MALSVKDPISPTDLADYELIKQGKIIVLIGMGDDKIVLKNEVAIYNPQHAKNANTTMKVVDPKAKLKLLTPVEAAIVRDFIINERDISSALSFGVRGSKPKINVEVQNAIDELSRLADGEQPAPIWEKMAFVDVKDLDKALQNRLDGNKDEIKFFIRTLKAGSGTPDGGLEMLGKIVAVDQFNGNTDRFVPNGCTGKFTYKTTKINFQTIQNLSNVFVAVTDGDGTVTGLDFVDGASEFKDINADLRTLEIDKIVWPFRTLAVKRDRNAFAARIAADLELCLNPKKSAANPFTKLGSDAAKRISKGMVLGAQLIKAKLEAKFKAPRSIGVKQRLEVLEEVKD